MTKVVNLTTLATVAFITENGLLKMCRNKIVKANIYIR